MVYPRVCGGTVNAGDVSFAFQGLSPRVRGNLTHRGSPSVAGFLASEPRKSRRADLSWPYGTIAKSEILA